MCVFLSATGRGPLSRTPTVHGRAEERKKEKKEGVVGGREGHSGFNQSLQPIELEFVLVQWPTPD